MGYGEEERTMGTAMNIREMQRCIEDNLATRLATQVELVREGVPEAGRTERADAAGAVSRVGPANPAGTR